ncbi:DegT/DnrJ/EryC1/StrS family aminotransferase [Candidatus Daviesbacteria bacterium]|nr:DegT/DnrJ/EryC1/StrS family aminotransferase [Candidatus Daviesbacteria bacterium]
MPSKKLPKQLKSNQEQIIKKVLYAMAVYGDEEIHAVLKSMENRWLASGPLVKEFEEKIASLFGKKFGVAVNSGSSANLVTLHLLNLPEGSEVITPACTFSTTVSTIIQNRLIPVFVDSIIGRYTINENLAEAAITKNTKAILAPHLVGGVCNMEKLRKLADMYNLYLIDDSCDTLAPRLNGKPVAVYGDMTTTSFYGSHIITALGFGGMLMTDDEKIYKRALTLRDWGRVGNDREAFEDRFNFEIDEVPYDAKFLYTEVGYNLKMNEAAAAFGLEQIKKLPQFLKIRQSNFDKMKIFFSQYYDWFYLPYLTSGAETNWLAFPLTVRQEAPFKRYDFLKHMESKGIQTRVLFSGNITRHPLYKKIEHRIYGKLEKADEIMRSGLLLGCHHGMTDEDVAYVLNSAGQFLSSYR